MNKKHNDSGGLLANRRLFVKGSVATYGLIASKGVLASESVAEVFKHGVASGDPDQTSVVIWTRVETSNPAEEVQWQVARDSRFRRIIAEGMGNALVHRDHTFKILVEGLKPGGSYYYRFKSKNQTSMTGMTRTLPEGELNKLTLALASCTNYAFGYFHSYKEIAADDDVEFVIHAGDYIYEYGNTGWGSEVANKLGRQHKPSNEIVSLQDYRIRHAQYKSDSDSILMHARHPLISFWDDHETTNDSWKEGADNHQPDVEGLWRERQNVALRAYFEWMPIRDLPIKKPQRDWWRTYRFGNLAQLVTLETRLSGRDKPLGYADHIQTITSQEAAESVRNKVLYEPGRRMISTEMEDYFRSQMAFAAENKIPWKLVGSGVLMAEVGAAIIC